MVDDELWPYLKCSNGRIHLRKLMKNSSLIVIRGMLSIGKHIHIQSTDTNKPGPNWFALVIENRR